MVVARGGERLEHCVKEEKGLRSTNQQLQNSHGEVGKAEEIQVNHTVLTMHGASWDTEYIQGTLVKYMVV